MLTFILITSLTGGVVHCSCVTVISPCEDSLGSLRRISEFDEVVYSPSVDPESLLEMFMRLFNVTIMVFEYIFPRIEVVVW